MAALLRRGLVEEWKGVTAGRLLAVGSDQLPNQMIERSAKVLDENTGNQAPLDWRLTLDDCEQDIARRLHVYPGDESETFRLCLVSDAASISAERDCLCTPIKCDVKPHKEVLLTQEDERRIREDGSHSEAMAKYLAN